MYVVLLPRHGVCEWMKTYLNLVHETPRDEPIQAGYHRSHELQEQAAAKNIVLHLLPPYSPNLNPIERLWKVMNEHARNNVFFESARQFKDAIAHFFHTTIPNIKPLLRARINDNFQVINPVSSG
jgi:transposase